ncbi:glucose-6-phosphate dehydrogenase [Candidatus Woesearchaeota archaeon]|nr:glucose-6-phosphate dehydrogenase [Candidatus Woesearchaeota archaeon]
MPEITFIILGVTGDLAKRKIIPAIYKLIEENKIEKFALVGAARRELEMKEILKEAREFIKDVKENIWQRLENNAYYQQFDFYDCQHYRKLGKILRNLESKHQLPGHRLFYLATLPDHFNAITLNLAKTGIAKEQGKKWSRLVYEKPFGHDLPSARKINRGIARVFNENQVYRIDHYLGKELVGNIAILRFTNRVLEPLWDSSNIQSVQIHFREKIGLEGRGNFYDKYGALKDVVQNHMLQMLALTAMEAPQKLTGKFIRDEKAKVLKVIKVKDLLLGQYSGYQKEKDVDSNSSTETFAAVKLSINNKRWKNVPFYLITGKNLDKKEVKIDIKFKSVHCLLSASCPSDTNYLTIRVQPDEGFSLELFAKVPGKANAVMPAKMNYCHECIRDLRSPEAYEILLEDVIKGDQSLFVRSDEIEYQWKVIKQILRKKNQIYEYNIGSAGPQELSLFEKKHHLRWRL